MALNSVVTAVGPRDRSGPGRSRRCAAGVEPEVAMNPILLKPTGERTSQVVVLGRPWQVADGAPSTTPRKPELLAAGARRAGRPAPSLRRRAVRGRGEPGRDQPARPRHREPPRRRRGRHPGDRRRRHRPRRRVRRALRHGRAAARRTCARCVRGFVINKLRGDPALLLDGCAAAPAAAPGVPDARRAAVARRRPGSTPRTRWPSIGTARAGWRRRRTPWPTSSTSPSCASRASRTSPTSTRSRIEPGVRRALRRTTGAGLGDA